MIDGKQCTISWHVDDLKLSHKYTKVVTSIIDSLSTKYGMIMLLSISCGKIHEYLGMTFNFTTDKSKVMITIYDHIDDVIDEAPDIYKSGIGSSTAGPTNLYTVRNPQDGKNLLLDKDREDYHTLTARYLYVSKCRRPNLQTSIAFHYTRVRQPTHDDQKKLARTTSYLIATRYLPLISAINKKDIVE